MILQDTRASQSLLVGGVLQLSPETAIADHHVLIHGIELGYVSVPIHKIFDLVSGYVTVGIDQLYL